MITINEIRTRGKNFPKKHLNGVTRRTIILCLQKSPFCRQLSDRVFVRANDGILCDARRSNHTCLASACSRKYSKYRRDLILIVIICIFV